MRKPILLVVGLLALALVACGGDYRPVTGPTLSIDTTSVAQSALTTDSVQTSRVTLTVKNTVPDLIIFIERSNNGLSDVEFEPATDGVAYLNLVFKAGSMLTVGTYTDTVQVRICRENPCVRQIAGSPQTITTTYTVQPPGAQAEPGITPLATESRNALAHNVIDAEFSKALNAVVMVSSWPSNALYVYNAANATEKKLLLNKVPTAVSVSPDGKTAAVGHDAMISHIDLTTVGQSGVTELTVSAVVGDLVLDGNGYVHVFPSGNQWVEVHTIKIASNTETLSPPWETTAGTLAKLHPDGNRLYAVVTQSSPDDIENYDVASGVISKRPVDSPYHGQYYMGGDLWLKADGSTIYTASGNTFRASVDPGSDMRYIGSIPLSPMDYNEDTYRIRSLSQSASAGEIALIEELNLSCSQPFVWPHACYSHLALYDDTYMSRSQVFAFPPVVVNSHSFRQQGLFAFHRNDNAKVLISRLLGCSDQSKEYYLSISN